MAIVVFRSIIDTFKTLFSSPLGVIKATFMFALASFLFFAAGLAPALFLFYMFIMLNVLNDATLMIVLAVFGLCYIVVWYLFSSYTAAYIRTLQEIAFGRVNPTLSRFIDLGKQYGKRYFVYVLIKNFVILVVVLPLAGFLVYSGYSELGIAASALVYAMFWVMTLFVPCAIVIDGQNAVDSIKRGVMFLARHPIDFIVCAVLIGVPWLLVFLIGPILSYLCFTYVGQNFIFNTFGSAVSFVIEWGIQTFILGPLAYLLLVHTYSYGK